MSFAVSPEAPMSKVSSCSKQSSIFVEVGSLHAYMDASANSSGGFYLPGLPEIIGKAKLFKI